MKKSIYCELICVLMFYVLLGYAVAATLLLYGFKHIMSSRKNDHIGLSLQNKEQSEVIGEEYDDICYKTYHDHEADEMAELELNDANLIYSKTVECDKSGQMSELASPSESSDNDTLSIKENIDSSHKLEDNKKNMNKPQSTDASFGLANKTKIVCKHKKYVPNKNDNLKSSLLDLVARVEEITESAEVGDESECFHESMRAIMECVDEHIKQMDAKDSEDLEESCDEMLRHDCEVIPEDEHLVSWNSGNEELNEEILRAESSQVANAPLNEENFIPQTDLNLNTAKGGWELFNNQSSMFKRILLSVRDMLAMNDERKDEGSVVEDSICNEDEVSHQKHLFNSKVNFESHTKSEENCCLESSEKLNECH